MAMNVKGELEINVKRGGIVGSAANIAGGMAGGGGILGGLSGIIGPLTAIAAGIGIIVSASSFLKGMLGSIFKAIMLIVKPIGDILGVALMPILQILRPIGLFFNMMMRPYIQKAMEAMRAGGQLLMAGDLSGAAQAYLIGFQFLAKPLFDMMIRSTEMALTGIADIIGTIFPPLAPAMDAVKETIHSGASAIITTTDDILNNQLQNILDQAASTLTEEGGFASKVNLGFAKAKQHAENWGDEFSKTIEEVFEGIIDTVSGMRTKTSLPAGMFIKPTNTWATDPFNYYNWGVTVESM